MIKKILSAVVITATALTMSGCSTNSTHAPVGDCVKVLIDYSSYKTNYSGCISELYETNALSVLDSAGINVVGTDKYGSQIVCRVNDFPSATQQLNIKDHSGYVESCKDMPAEFAYWAVLLKSPNGDWKWAETGIDKVNLINGDSIALVFSVNGNTKFPN